MKRPQDWSPEEKLAVVLEAASLSEEDLGPFLRSRGLHEAYLHDLGTYRLTRQYGFCQMGWLYCWLVWRWLR